MKGEQGDDPLQKGRMRHAKWIPVHHSVSSETQCSAAALQHCFLLASGSNQEKKTYFLRRLIGRASGVDELRYQQRLLLRGEGWHRGFVGLQVTYAFFGGSPRLPRVSVFPSLSVRVVGRVPTNTVDGSPHPAR